LVAASSSMATMVRVLSAISPKRRAAKVAILVILLIGRSGQAVDARRMGERLVSEARAAAVTWAIMKPELRPASRQERRQAG
jgi:hypothetical protein